MLQAHRSTVVPATIFVGILVINDGDFRSVGFDIIVASNPVDIHLEYGSLTVLFADGFDLNHLGYAETCKFADALASQDGTVFRRGPFSSLVTTSGVSDFQKPLLAFLEFHAYAIVADRDFSGFSTGLGQCDGDPGGIGIPSVGHEFRDGRDRALVHLNAQMVDDAPTVVQPQRLVLPYGMRYWISGHGRVLPERRAYGGFCQKQPDACRMGNMK